jgi:D-alanyl-D-alanine carboxypeptidase
MRCLKLIICLIFLNYFNAAVGLTPRYSAIVIEVNSGRVLDQEGADKICHPASLTKMMTLYMVFESLKAGRIHMDTKVLVSSHAARQIPCKLGLRPGEYVTIETIIKGMVTKSANDASAAFAEYIGGSEANFATMMTQKAKKLGMTKTIFKNSSGVPNSQQITTARDMAILSRALYLHFPKEYRHFRLKAFHHKGQRHHNHNHLLGNRRDFEVDGIKTGYVAASGFNLAASAVRRGPDNKSQRLIAVVLGGPNRHWRDRRVQELLEINFAKVGLGIGTAAKDVDEDEEDDEGENTVKAFLKEDAPKLDPIKVTVPAPTVAAPPPSKKNDWGVQLGTFASVKEAQSKARKSLSLLKSGEISTPRVKQGKRSVYGARLLGITKEEAQNVCRKYAKNGGSCRLLASEKS